VIRCLPLTEACICIKMHMQYNALSAVNEAGRYGNCDMAWEVEFTDEFGTWWGELTENEQDAIDRTIGLLEDRGPLWVIHTAPM
jgi:hypothetical protein